MLIAKAADRELAGLLDEFRGVRPATSAPMQERIARHEAEVSERLLNILTPTQRERFERLRSKDEP